jgi:hypothetical protein
MRKFDPANKYGRLQPTHRSARKHGREAIWVCTCDCGKSIEVRSWYLLSGHTKSCGCLRGDTLREMRFKHGLTKTREHRIWCHVTRRCLRPDNHAYDDYGGRGITVCERWQGEDGFMNFLADMGPAPSTKHSIERRDNNAGYSPENCVWATQKQQCRNKRSNRMITHDGRTQCLVAWAEEVGIGTHTIGARLKRGWTPAEALTTPVGVPRSPAP